MDLKILSHAISTCCYCAFNWYEFLTSKIAERCESNFTSVFVKLTLHIEILSSSCETGLMLVLHNSIVKKLTLVQAMAWCRHATRHHLSPCWPMSVSSDDVTGSQWDISLSTFHVIHLPNQTTHNRNKIQHSTHCVPHKLMPRPNGCRFVDGDLKCISVNEYIWIFIKMSLKLIYRGTTNNISALDQIMA